MGRRVGARPARASIASSPLSARRARMDNELPRPQVPGPAQPSAGGAATAAPGYASGGLEAEGLRARGPRRAPAKAAGSILDLVMPMRVGGDGPALFCAHTLVGLSWYYLALLPHVNA